MYEKKLFVIVYVNDGNREFYLQVPPLYGLNTDDVTEWNECVLTPAISIIESYMQEKQCQYDRMPFQDVRSKPNAEDTTYKCIECNRIFVGDYQWEEHIKSRKHRLRLAKFKKEAKCRNVEFGERRIEFSSKSD